MTLDEAIALCPVVAILRGIRPGECLATAQALHAAGIRVVEVPLSSPQPLETISRLAGALGEQLVIGGGTVLTAEAAREVADAGGRLVVSPITSRPVIEMALRLGMEPAPGVATPTEAFAALEAGARHLKLFPAASLGPGYLRQLMAVLPGRAVVWAVGGVGPGDIAAWREAGAGAFALGAELYRPGQGAAETAKKAALAVAAARA
ncbi:MAG TPA: 2-dehydro-3-deoxy-6-phosphogalactonate aldolase [Caulobacteraceae bacterium]